MLRGHKILRTDGARLHPSFRQQEQKLPLGRRRLGIGALDLLFERARCMAVNGSLVFFNHLRAANLSQQHFP